MFPIVRAISSINRCDYYVILWCLIQIEEVIHINGIISQGIQAALLFWTLYEGSGYLLPDYRHPLMLKATSILTFMYIVYGSIFIIMSPAYFDLDPHYIYLKSFLVSFMPVFMFYKYTLNKYLTESRLCIYIYIFLLIVIIQFFHLNSVLMSKWNREDVTNNCGYLFLQLFPLIFLLYRNRILQYSIAGIIALFILLSMKRGAIAICAICFIWFLWDSIKKSTSIKHKYTTIVLGSGLVITAFSTITYMLATSDFLNARIEETEQGKTSGRDIIYTKISDAIVNDDSYFHLFFGRGAYASIDVAHKMAHNDWLETACNNGLIGILCLMFFLFAFYRTARKVQQKLRPEISSLMMMLLFIFFLRTFFSMSLQYIPIYVTMLVAYFTFCTIEDKVIFTKET